MRRLDDADHARVTAAVAAAERGTDGEIVAVVAASSDGYYDVALVYGVAAMIWAIGIVAFVPGWAQWLAAWHAGGWSEAADLPRLLLLVMLVQAAAFLLVRYALSWPALRIALVPRSVKARRVRRRATDLFRAGAEARTTGRVGILLYLSLDEHMAEIVADAAIHAKVPPERWGDAMVDLVDRVREGDVAGGMAAAVGTIGGIVAAHFPKSARDPNELPDRLIEL